MFLAASVQTIEQRNIARSISVISRKFLKMQKLNERKISCSAVVDNLSVSQKVPGSAPDQRSVKQHNLEH